MSWEGWIPRREYKFKGLRNKRSQNSPKAILAKKAKMAKKENPEKADWKSDGFGSKDERW